MIHYENEAGDPQTRQQDEMGHSKKSWLKSEERSGEDIKKGTSRKNSTIKADWYKKKRKREQGVKVNSWGRWVVQTAYEVHRFSFPRLLEGGWLQL